MTHPRLARWFLFTVSLALFGVEIYTLAAGATRDPDQWFLSILAMILSCLAAAVVLTGREIHPAAVLSLLLVCFSVIIGIRPTDWMAPDSASGHSFGLVVNAVWDGMLLLSPFLFIHLSLIFPVPNRWVERNPSRLYLMYAPWLILFALLEWEVAFDTQISGALDYTLLLVPGGFALGISVFVVQYLVALTPAEKNRLRVILIGSLAGGAPWMLALAGRTFGLGGAWEYVAYFLVPLFPLSLALAVVREDFYDFGRPLERILLCSLVTAGAISVFYLSLFVLRSQSAEAGASETGDAFIALMLAAMMVFLIRRWAWSRVPTLLNRAPKLRRNASPSAVFEPIQPNPYIVGNPVQSADMFFGRKEEFHFIRTKLQGQNEGCVILLYGERRSGKTSILHQVVNGRLGGHFVPAFLDMQGMIVEDDREFLQALTAIVRAALPGQGGANSILDPGCVDSYLDFSSFMDGVMHVLAGKQLVLLIDEYELIEHKVGQGRIRAEIFDYLTSLLERFPRQLSLILTGSRSLEAHEAWHSLAGKSFARKISFLSPRDAADLICSPLQDRASYSRDAVGDVLRLTSGHPFFTQLVCQMTVELLNEQRANQVDRGMLQVVTERVLENPPPQLLYQWNGFSSQEKLLLAVLAALLKTPQSSAAWDHTHRSVQSLPGEHREGLDAPGIRMLLESLRLRDVLDRDRTRYRFTMDLVRRWVRYEHNVWAVLHRIKAGKHSETQAPTRRAPSNK